jgi:serine/threonine-protein kinase
MSEADKRAATSGSQATAPLSVDPGLPADLITSLELTLRDLQRYEVLGLLGRGGMGAVYRARDRQLNRIVALKFILGAHPDLIARFLQEARAQARIDHPNVCHVYEVGEVAGRAYIAMQFVDGVELSKAYPKMSLDERVATMRDVALALHEAHKVGIVHRDVKPSNVLVEHRDNDGRWFPVVMDFGLAREASDAIGLTQTGAVMGTPAYMSPEQARGETRAVDRRADVYSLGATAYELFTGQPPFAAAPLAEVLQQVLHQEPRPPRSLAPQLPVDLETIILKCLAKEPAGRYASARALADDFSRYLDGMPIAGRRVPWWQRLRRRARRHRALVAVSTAALVAIAVLAGLGLRARARAAERARLAEGFGRDTKELEWLMRSAAQLPLHDTTAERTLTRERMRRIAATPHHLGRDGDALMHEALGRGHLALHEWDEAAAELDRAAAAGFDTPSLYAARGRALGELYHCAVEDARRAGDRAWLDGRIRALQAQYLTPALADLDRSRAAGLDAGDDPETLAALLALYRGDYAAAESLALSLSAAARAAWLTGALKIAADAAYAAALVDFDHGRYDAARPRLEHATTLYAQAADAARSDATVLQATAEAWLQRAELDHRQGPPAARGARARACRHRAGGERRSQGWAGLQNQGLCARRMDANAGVTSERPAAAARADRGCRRRRHRARSTRRQRMGRARQCAQVARPVRAEPRRRRRALVDAFARRDRQGSGARAQPSLGAQRRRRSAPLARRRQ